MSNTRLREPLGPWTSPPRQKFTWYARPNKQTLLHVSTTSVDQHIKKRSHHNSQNNNQEFFPQRRDFTQQWPLDRRTALLADVSIKKGSKAITLHSTTPQFVPQSPQQHPPITTEGDFIRKLHPFLQQLVPHPNELDSTFTEKANLLATVHHLSARTTCLANTQHSRIHISWTIKGGNDLFPETLARHQSSIHSCPEETHNK
jgi:hypothetical protein